MADYKKMYLTALDAMERAMELLAEAERACEEIYINSSKGRQKASFSCNFRRGRACGRGCLRRVTFFAERK